MRLSKCLALWVVIAIELSGCTDKGVDNYSVQSTTVSKDNSITAGGYSTATPVPSSYSAMPDAENLPLYPDVQNVVIKPVRVSAQGTILETTFTSLVDATTIEQFYFTTLRTLGWVPAPDLAGNADGKTPSLLLPNGYVWADRNGESPWKLSLRINFSDSPNSGEHKTIGNLRLERWPIMEKIPIYLKSTGVSERDEIIKTYRPYNEHIVSYETQDSPATVQAFYRSIMPLYGWPLPDAQENLTYHYQVGGPDFLLVGINAHIIIVVSTKGQTHVELRTHGIDNTAPLWQKLWNIAK